MSDDTLERFKPANAQLLLEVAVRQAQFRHGDRGVSALLNAQSLVGDLVDEQVRSELLRNVEAASQLMDAEADATSPEDAGEVQEPVERARPDASHQSDASPPSPPVQWIVDRLTAGPESVAEIEWAIRAIRSHELVGPSAELENDASLVDQHVSSAIEGAGPAPAGDALLSLHFIGLADAFTDAFRAVKVVLADPDSIVQTVQTRDAVLAAGGRQLLAAARVAADRKDRDGFEDFLVPCAFHPEIFAELCLLLARVYPRQSVEIVDTLIELQDE